MPCIIYLMVHLTKILILGLSGLMVCSRAADLGDYQIILDRNLLGVEQPPPEPEPPPPPPPAAASWANDYVMTMMSKDPSGLRVGLQNKRNGQAFLLIEKDPQASGNYMLVSGDFDSGTANIRHGNQSHQFTIQTGPVVKAQSRPSTGRVSRTSNASVGQSGDENERPITPRRRIVRRRVIPQESSSEEQRFNSREELQRHLEEQQLDAIRTGKPPLPVPVTDDMVDQLIEEGWSLPEEN